MRRNALLRIVMIALFTSAGLAFQAGTDGPYKVLKTAKVGGERRPAGGCTSREVRRRRRRRRIRGRRCLPSKSG